MRREVLVAAVAVACLALPGCRSGSREPASDLHAAVIASVDGFELDDGPSGPMDLELAARATTTRREVLRRYLRRSGFQDGYARVFRDGDEFVTVLVYDFFDERNARGMVDLTIEELRRSAAYQPFTDPDVPQSRGYTLASDVDGRVRFCVGEWFWVAERAYSVTRCAPYVLSVPVIKPVVTAQHALAVRAGASPS